MESDSSKLQQQWQRAVSELEVVKRQSIVYSLYGRKHKNVLVSGWRCTWRRCCLRAGWVACCQAARRGSPSYSSPSAKGSSCAAAALLNVSLLPAAGGGR